MILYLYQLTRTTVMYTISKSSSLLSKIFLQFFLLFFLFTNSLYAETNTKKLVYLVSDINIPFWKILSKGIQTI